MIKTIDLAKEFSRFPAGRMRTDSQVSGEYFRDDYLVPALKQGSEKVYLVIDGVAGLPSSFLEEVAGGLVRCGFAPDYLRARLEIVAKTPRMISYIKEFWGYVDKSSSLLKM